MHAIGYRRHGDVSVLEQFEASKPEPKRGEVIVRVHAFGLNPLDYRLRRGELRLITSLKMPRLIGSDFAGTVDSIGADVHSVGPNDTVFGMVSQLLNGCSAEFIRVPESQLAKMPSSLNFEVGAAVPLAALTAYQALTDIAQVKPGDKVLINGASGGVGTFATQLARFKGAEVTAVTSFRNTALVSELGAHHVVDYTQRDFVEVATGFDLIFDCYGNRTFEQVQTALNSTGRYITTIPAVSRYRSVLFNPLRAKKSSVVIVRARGYQLTEIGALIDNGDLKPIVERVFEYSAFRDAYLHLESKRSKGKLSVKMA
jgi:NADPH:quinone reductase-like Zn-dependent oxidoreductase